MTRKIAITLSDERAIEIVDGIPEERRDERIEKYIIVGHLVLSHATIATSRDAAESLFAPLSEDIATLREQLALIVPTISKTQKKGEIAEEYIFSSYAEAFIDDVFENVSKKGEFTDILAFPRGTNRTVFIEVKNYKGTVPSAQVDKFWRDMKAHGAKYGIFISTETPIAKVSGAIHMEMKSGKTGVFVVNSALDYVGHLISYKIVRRLIEHELSFAQLGKEELRRVNATLARVKADIQMMDEIRGGAEKLRGTATKSLTSIIEQASLVKRRIEERIEELFASLGHQVTDKEAPGPPDK